MIVTSIKIQDRVFGDGKVLLCAPLTSPDEKTMRQDLEILSKSDADIIEWRLDLFQEEMTSTSLIMLLKMIKDHCQDKLLLTTIRTKAEGGSFSSSIQMYKNIYATVIQSRYADLIDIEYSMADDIREHLISLAHEHDQKVIVSSHDFIKTASFQELKTLAEKMAETHGDIVKIAVMPRDALDVARLLEVSAWAKNCLQKPFITMAMGRLGGITRLVGEEFGSCVSFVKVCDSSAPGQLSIHDVQTFLKFFHRVLSERE